MAELARLIKAADGVLEGLDPYQRAYMKAYTTRDPEAFRVLVQAVHAELPTGVHSRRGIEKLVREHFGHTIGNAAARADLRCNEDMLKEYRRQVRARMFEIRESLREALAGMLESTTCK